MHILIVIVVGSNPTWANFLYQLLKAFTQIWIPQVSLQERELEAVREWEKERERVRDQEKERVWESERLRVRENQRVRDGKSKSEKVWEWVRESERSRVRIHRNTTKFMWAYLKSWPDKSIFWASMQSGCGFKSHLGELSISTTKRFHSILNTAGITYMET